MIHNHRVQVCMFDHSKTWNHTSLLEFLHTLLCCTFYFKWIKLPFWLINLHSITHNDKVHFSKYIIYQNLKSQISLLFALIILEMCLELHWSYLAHTCGI